MHTMRVLVIVDPQIPVPPVHYGGTERIAALVCSGLAARGHIVDLIAGVGSRSYGGRLYTHTAPTRAKVSRAYRKILFQFLLAWAVRHADVVVCHGRIDYLWWLLKTSKPVVVQLQNPTSQREIDWLVGRRDYRLRIVGVSRDHVAGLQPAAIINTIPNATDLDRFHFCPTPEPPVYFAFLGRLTANKGVHLAIEAARTAGVRLKIAGTVSSEPGGEEYFATQVKPYLGGDIEYVGPVNDAQKASLLGGATGLLFPIQWREPFGIVMAEALACGCPVIGWRNGSVPEVVRHGETGFIVNSVEQMATAIRDIGQIDRAACRRDAETRFSPDALVEAYLRVFGKLVRG